MTCDAMGNQCPAFGRKAPKKKKKKKKEGAGYFNAAFIVVERALILKVREGRRCWCREGRDISIRLAAELKRQHARDL